MFRTVLLYIPNLLGARTFRLALAAQLSPRDSDLGMPFHAYSWHTCGQSAVAVGPCCLGYEC